MATGRKIFFGLAAALVLFTTTHAGAQIIDSLRGFADTGANYNDLQAVDANWYYNWGLNPNSTGGFGAKFYPMFKHGTDVTTGNINNVLSQSPTYALGFNEPEVSSQGNTTVAQAEAVWNTLYTPLHAAGIKVVSPAVSDTSDGHTWISSFMSAESSEVDAVAFHWYDVSTPDPTTAFNDLKSSLSFYHQWGKPVFITEFAIHDWGGSYTDQQISDANQTFLNLAIPYMESLGWVSGYSWYNWFSDASLFTGTSPNYTPTQMSYSYIGAIGSNNIAGGATTSDLSGQNLGEKVADLANGTVTVTSAASSTQIKYVNALMGYNAVSGTVNWGLAGSSNWVRIQSGATLNKTGTNQITFSGGTITNNGVLQVMQGTLVLGSSMSGTGSAVVRSTSTLSLTSSGSMNSAALIDVRTGGTLNVSALTNGLSLQNTQNLNVDGSTIGNFTALPGSLVSGGGTFGGNLTAQSGSTIQVGKNGSGVASRILVDNFDSYAVGNLNAMSTPWTSHEDSSFASIASFNGSNVLTYGWGDNTDNRGASRPLPAGTVLDNNSTATYFFQIAATNNNPNHSFGLATHASTGTENFGDYETQLRMKAGTGSTFAIDARSGGAFSNTLASGLALNTWYNIWMVVNQPTDTYDIYMNTGTDAATTANKLNSAPLAFRNGTTADLTELLALAGTSTVSDGGLLDNVYYQSGVDLSNPLLNFDPGLTWAPATMTVSGNYIQNAGSTLALNLQSPSSHDLLQVSGHANLAGTLNVTFAIGASTPHIGDTYQLINASTISGAFSTLQMPALSGGLAWDTSHLSADGSVSIFSGLPGDFNQDGHVDASDLQAMLLALSDRSAYESQFNMDDFELQTFGDVNHDGAFSNADIQAFLNLLQSGGGSAAPVPEPESFLLISMASALSLLWVSRNRGRRCR